MGIRIKASGNRLSGRREGREWGTGSIGLAYRLPIHDCHWDFKPAFSLLQMLTQKWQYSHEISKPIFWSYTHVPRLHKHYAHGQINTLHYIDI